MYAKPNPSASNSHPTSVMNMYSKIRVNKQTVKEYNSFW